MIRLTHDPIRGDIVESLDDCVDSNRTARPLEAVEEVDRHSDGSKVVMSNLETD